MKVDDLGSGHFAGAEIRLKPGTVIMVVTDDGPSGPCGQSMNVTCPHTSIHIFPDEGAMRDFVEKSGAGRGGRREQVRHCVIGNYSSPGVMHLVRHQQSTNENTLRQHRP